MTGREIIRIALLPVMVCFALLGLALEWFVGRIEAMLDFYDGI